MADGWHANPKDPSEPPEKKDETKTLETVVVNGHKNKKDSNGNPIEFGDGTEHAYVVTPDGITPAPIKPVGEVNCGGGLTVMKFAVAAPKGATRGHTHPNSYGAAGSVPGPGDNAAAKASSAGVAFTITNDNVFTIESFSNNTHRVTVNGGGLSASQRANLIANMQVMESPSASAPASGATDKQKYCKK